MCELIEGCKGLDLLDLSGLGSKIDDSLVNSLSSALIHTSVTKLALGTLVAISRSL